MSTVEILARTLEQSGLEAATYVWCDYTLRVVAGRPGSVCFTLLQEIPPTVWIVQAEGFTLGDAIHYTQHLLAEAERIIRLVTDAQNPAASPRSLPVEPASRYGGDLAADA